MQDAPAVGPLASSRCCGLGAAAPAFEPAPVLAGCILSCRLLSVLLLTSGAGRVHATRCRHPSSPYLTSGAARAAWVCRRCYVTAGCPADAPLREMRLLRLLVLLFRLVALPLRQPLTQSLVRLRAAQLALGPQLAVLLQQHAPATRSPGICAWNTTWKWSRDLLSAVSIAPTSQMTACSHIDSQADLLRRPEAYRMLLLAATAAAAACCGAAVTTSAAPLGAHGACTSNALFVSMKFSKACSSVSFPWHHTAQHSEQVRARATPEHASTGTPPCHCKALHFGDACGVRKAEVASLFSERKVFRVPEASPCVDHWKPFAPSSAAWLPAGADPG